MPYLSHGEYWVSSDLDSGGEPGDPWKRFRVAELAAGGANGQPLSSYETSFACETPFRWDGGPNYNYKWSIVAGWGAWPPAGLPQSGAGTQVTTELRRPRARPARRPRPPCSKTATSSSAPSTTARRAHLSRRPAAGPPGRGRAATDGRTHRAAGAPRDRPDHGHRRLRLGEVRIGDGVRPSDRTRDSLRQRPQGQNADQGQREGRFPSALPHAQPRRGTYRVRARVEFKAASGTRPRTLSLRFSRCAARSVKPKFTG